MGYQDGLHLYEYVRSSPISAVDPTGRFVIIDDIICCICLLWNRSDISQETFEELDQWLDDHPNADSCDEDAMQHCIGAAKTADACWTACAFFGGLALEWSQWDFSMHSRDDNNNAAGAALCGDQGSTAVSCCNELLDAGLLDTTPDEGGGCL